MIRLRPLFLALAVSLCCSETHAAEITTDGKGIITLEGRIVPGDGARMEDAIRASIKALYKRDQPVLLFIGLNSGGGDLEAANDVSKAMIRFRNLGGRLITIVPNGAYCNSACVLLFAIGEGRAVWGNGTIGVHRAQSASTHLESSGSMVANGMMAAGLGRFGAPASVIAKLMSTAADDIADLDADDYAAWGVKVMQCQDGTVWTVCH